MGRTHWFSIEKARAQLGYEPDISSLEGAELMAKIHALSQPQGQGQGQGQGPARGSAVKPTHYFQLASVFIWALVGCGMGSLYMVAYRGTPAHFAALPAPLPFLLPYINSFALSLLSVSGLQVLFQLAVALHALEAVYSLTLCDRLGVIGVVQCLWFVQTLCLGFGSIRLLQRRLRQEQGLQ